jgi:hypothetical protein
VHENVAKEDDKDVGRVGVLEEGVEADNKDTRGVGKPADVTDSGVALLLGGGQLLAKTSEELGVKGRQKVPARSLVRGSLDTEGSVCSRSSERRKAGELVEVSERRGVGRGGAEKEGDRLLSWVKGVRDELGSSRGRTVGAVAEVRVGVGLLAEGDADIAEEPVAPGIAGSLVTILARHAQLLDKDNGSLVALLVAAVLDGNDITALESVGLESALEFAGGKRDPLVV